MWPSDLPDSILERIVALLSIRQRIISLSKVSKAFHRAVKRSIKSVAFYKDHLDGLSDEKLKRFLAIYGKQIKHLNLDLFRADQKVSQWQWRQMVKYVTTNCGDLRSLDLLICERHKLRDEDLIQVFRNCYRLEELRIDAQFISGHCFLRIPPSVSRLELDMCVRLSVSALGNIAARCGRKLRTLHLSHFTLLNNAIVLNLVRNCRMLEDISFVSHPEAIYPELTGNFLAKLGQLRQLKILCLEGMASVTDRFLEILTDTSKFKEVVPIRSLSLAFCFNVSGTGIGYLSRLSGLKHLNLDGVSRRDISGGLLQLVQARPLETLLLAENTAIDPDSLPTIIFHSPQLHLIDLSGNRRALTQESAMSMVMARLAFGSNRKILTVLTDDHRPWRSIVTPNNNAMAPPPIRIIHLHQQSIPRDEIQPGNVLDDVDDVVQLPPGLAVPQLRRGNRYRLLWGMETLADLRISPPVPLMVENRTEDEESLDLQALINYLSLAERYDANAVGWSHAAQVQ